MQIRVKTFLIGLAIVAAMALPMTAFADSCANVSRAAPTNYVPGSGPLIEGNWVWLPSIGVPFPAWGFAPPGTPDSALFPGANGNYTNGQTWSLLGMSAICQQRSGGVANRQITNGIQSGCVGP